MKQLPFIYTVNDDLFMKNILSGAYLGTPDAHTVYMEYPLALFIKFLYGINGELPWYGISLLVFQILAWTAVGYRLLSGEKNKKYGIIKLTFLLLLFGAVGFYHMASMQFTVTAAIVGMAALVWFYTSDFEKTTPFILRDNIVSLFLAVLSFGIRRNVLLMLLPFAGMLWLRKSMDYRKKQKQRMVLVGETAGIWREQIEKFGVIVLVFGVGLSLVYSLNHYGYQSKPWQDYHAFNDAATVLYDYYGWPDYEDNKELYQELDISFEAYEGAKTSYLLSMDNNIDTQAMEKLAQHSQELYRQEHSVVSRLSAAVKDAVLRMVTDTDRPLNFIVITLYSVILLLAAVSKKKEVLLSLAYLWIGRSASWLYVIFEGRYPTRISQSLLLAECGILAAILLREALPAAEAHRKESELCRRRTWLSGAALILGIFYIALIGGLSLARIRHVAVENHRRMEESRDLQELKDYCLENNQNFYFVDSKSISNETESVFRRGGNQYENYIVFGGWLSKSPVYEGKLALAGVENAETDLLSRDNLYVIFEDSERCPKDYLINYFSAKYQDFQMKEVDRFGAVGEPFVVYRLQRGNQGLEVD